MTYRIASTMCLLAALLSVGCDNGGWPAECPNPNREDVWYYHSTWEARDSCMVIDVACPAGTVPLHQRFPEMQGLDCGCGCFGEPEDGWPEQGD